MAPRGEVKHPNEVACDSMRLGGRQSQRSDGEVVPIIWSLAGPIDRVTTVALTPYDPQTIMGRATRAASSPARAIVSISACGRVCSGKGLSYPCQRSGGVVVEPVIRNYRSVSQPGGAAARLISLEDNSTTCTMTYSVIEPGKTSAHHIHPWEHEVYILEGSGVVVCDGKEYPVREGDGMFIPGNVDHYTLNNRSNEIGRASCRERV